MMSFFRRHIASGMIVFAGVVYFWNCATGVCINDDMITFERGVFAPGGDDSGEL